MSLLQEQYEAAHREREDIRRGDSVGVRNKDGLSFDEWTRANLHLVRAAPDLLVALKSAEYFLLDRAHLPNGPDFADTLRAVSAAIAKAEGK
jgi:hypothetical protein